MTIQYSNRQSLTSTILPGISDLPQTELARISATVEDELAPVVEAYRDRDSVRFQSTTPIALARRPKPWPTSAVAWIR
jgi:hypothetical protein